MHLGLPEQHHHHLGVRPMAGDLPAVYQEIVYVRPSHVVPRWLPPLRHLEQTGLLLNVSRHIWLRDGSTTSLTFRF